jgi:hypothetical protein
MNLNKKKELASILFKLENECQLGKDLTENLAKMTRITETLSLDEILELAEYMEEVTCKV